MTMKATIAAMTPMAIEPANSHAAAPTRPDPTVEPTSLPSSFFSTPPTTGTTMNSSTKIIAGSKPPPRAGAPRAFGGGQRLAFGQDVDHAVDAGVDAGAERALAELAARRSRR